MAEDSPKMAPGQAPYKGEEIKSLHSLVGSSAFGDPGEQSESESKDWFAFAIKKGKNVTFPDVVLLFLKDYCGRIAVGDSRKGSTRILSEKYDEIVSDNVIVLREHLLVTPDHRALVLPHGHAVPSYPATTKHVVCKEAIVLVDTKEVIDSLWKEIRNVR